MASPRGGPPLAGEETERAASRGKGNRDGGSTDLFAFGEACAWSLWVGLSEVLDELRATRALIRQKGGLCAAHSRCRAFRDPRRVEIAIDELPPEVQLEQRPRSEPVPATHSRVDEVFDRMVVGSESFWSVVYGPFMTRDLTRDDVRVIVQRGLQLTRGNYAGLMKTFNMMPEDYKRFLNFLRKHQCQLNFSPVSRTLGGTGDRARSARRSGGASYRRGDRRTAPAWSRLRSYAVVFLHGDSVPNRRDRTQIVARDLIENAANQRHVRVVCADGD